MGRAAACLSQVMVERGSNGCRPSIVPSVDAQQTAGSIHERRCRRPSPRQVNTPMRSAGARSRRLGRSENTSEHHDVAPIRAVERVPKWQYSDRLAVEGQPLHQHPTVPGNLIAPRSPRPGRPLDTTDMADMLGQIRRFWRFGAFLTPAVGQDETSRQQNEGHRRRLAEKTNRPPWQAGCNLGQGIRASRPRYSLQSRALLPQTGRTTEQIRPHCYENARSYGHVV